jgi:BsuBI/PstI restriction endonuclease domain/BsuBI/PstI restriction endonuclease HTH domain
VSGSVADTWSVLEAIDFPFDSLPNAWAMRAPKVVLALGRIRNSEPVGAVRAWGDQGLEIIGSRQLIDWLNSYWGEQISRGSYDEVRRRCVQFLVAAGVALKDPDNANRSPNSPATGYALSQEFVSLLKAYGSPEWIRQLRKFRKNHESLKEKFRAERELRSVAVTLPDGAKLQLSPGDHNKLQAAIIDHFLPQFILQPEVLYIADALNRQLYRNDSSLEEAGLSKFDHRLLPDVIVLDRKRHWLIVIEAVANSGHISPLRKIELRKLLVNCKFPPVFVTAFPDYKTFGRFAGDIAWETEVWIAEHSTHMIHFNGERFLGPY